MAWKGSGTESHTTGVQRKLSLGERGRWGRVQGSCIWCRACGVGRKGFTGHRIRRTGFRGYCEFLGALFNPSEF